MKKNESGQGLIEYALVLILVAVVLIAVLSLFPIGKTDDITEQNTVVHVTDATAGSFDIGVNDYHKYEYTVVHGMPCLVYRSTSMTSITCDWTQWEGLVDGDQVILKE